MCSRARACVWIWFVCKRQREREIQRERELLLQCKPVQTRTQTPTHVNICLYCRAGPLGLQSPLKRYRDMSPLTRDAPITHTLELSSARRDVLRETSPAGTQASAWNAAKVAGVAGAHQRQGLRQHQGQTIATKRASMEASAVSLDASRMEGSGAGSAETPVQHPSSAVPANAPGKAGGGGVALFGAYHTTGKSLQVPACTHARAPSPQE